MKKQLFSFLYLFILLSYVVNAQEFQAPRPSPTAKVSQFIGVTEVTINYSRPGVKDRKIWGELVPYNQVWRTGANAVTSITFTDPVKINGNELPEGTYGIHTIPTEAQWTVIFSKNTEVGGSSEFKEENAALKITVKPEQSSFNERLIFTFTDVTDNSAKVNLAWEKLSIPFTIETNTSELVISKANNAISWSVPMQAAQWCLQNNSNLDLAMNWINASTLINENYWNMRIKAQLLAKSGQKQQAVSVMEKAIDHGSKMPDRPFDYDAMTKLLAEWKS